MIFHILGAGICTFGNRDPLFVWHRDECGSGRRSENNSLDEVLFIGSLETVDNCFHHLGNDLSGVLVHGKIPCLNILLASKFD